MIVYSVHSNSENSVIGVASTHEKAKKMITKFNKMLEGDNFPITNDFEITEHTVDVTEFIL